MAIRLMLVTLLWAASIAWAGPSDHPARPAHANDPAEGQFVTNSESAWRKPGVETDEFAARPRTSARPGADPVVRQHRAAFRPGRAAIEPQVTNAAARYRPDPAAAEQSVRSPGPAASVELAPNEAESRCLRSEGQVRCTPVQK